MRPWSSFEKNKIRSAGIHDYDGNETMSLILSYIVSSTSYIDNGDTNNLI